MNTRVLRHLKSASTSAPPMLSNLLQRECVCGGHAGIDRRMRGMPQKEATGVQTKLKINQPEDIYEQEADRIADEMVATPANFGARGAAIPRNHRISGQSAEQMDAPPSVYRALANPGKPLEST